MDVHNLTADAEAFTCNAYLALDDGHATLVDAGSMDGIVAEIERHTDSLDSVLITHQHEDHVEKLPAVVEAFEGLRVYAGEEHELRTDAVEDAGEVPIAGEPFEAVYTPGHADDHFAFFSEDALFSGDAVVHDDGAFEGGSFGRTDMAGQSRDALIRGIERLLGRLPASVGHMYSGHGGVYHGDVRAIVETALERAERKEPKY
jgi:glyoxylase-like metal-dependent hydrolase (beta-lactamase superfamily II)